MHVHQSQLVSYGLHSIDAPPILSPCRLHKEYTGAIDPGGTKDLYIDAGSLSTLLYVKLPRYGIGMCGAPNWSVCYLSAAHLG